MQSFESRRFWRSIAVGVALTVLACSIDQLGWLSALDGWFRDKRNGICQLFSKAPDPRIEHVDIDDASLDPGALGRWPWSRKVVARILKEIAVAKPAAVALDLFLSEPETSSISTTQPSEILSPADSALAEALSRQKNLVLAEDVNVEIGKAFSPIFQAARSELSANLQLGTDDLLQRLRARGDTFDGDYDFQDLFIRARRSAMADRVATELNLAPLSDDLLAQRLLPGIDTEIITAPVVKVLHEEAQAYRTRKAFEGFGFIPPPGISPIPTNFQQIPMRSFSDHAQECGFVNYDFFNSSIVRSIPLIVKADGRLYPQFGLAFACAIVGADPRNAVVTADRIRIPAPNGQPLEIPVHPFYSRTLGQKFSCVADIPWFGTHDWTTMYDWPNHLRPANHMSVNVIWDICATADKIVKNNKAIDAVMNDLFASEGNFSFDTAFADQYFKGLPPTDDDLAREKIGAIALKKLSEIQQIKDIEMTLENARTQNQKEWLAQLQDDRLALTNAMNESKAARRQIVEARQKLSNRLGGKGVLFGWTAEGNIDHVSTSLHTSCPGVVVHGVIAQAVLSRNWKRETPAWLGILIVLALGGLTTFLVADLQPVRASVSTVLLLAGYLLLNGYILFDYGHWLVPVAGPFVTVLAVWSGCTLQRVIYEGVERNRVATEVAIINKEMDLARKVQAALIPKSAPVIPGLVANGWTMAASVAGGDCYDLWTLPDGRLGILLADASGHGLAPAMVVSQVRTLVRALCDVETHPHGLLQRINARVAEDLETGRFITVFLGFLGSDGLLEYASAGHGPQFWYGCDGEEMMELDSTGAPLGFDNEWLADEPMPPLQISDGCSLVIFSDGIFEAMDPKGEVYGIDRLKSLLHDARGKPGKFIIDKVIAAMEIWQHKYPPADDQTVVIAQRVALPTA